MTSFSSRLGWVYAGLVTTSTALVLVVGGWLLDAQMTRGLEWLHAREAEEIEELLGSGGETTLTPQEVEARIGRDAEADATLYFMQLHEAAGAVVFRSRNLGALVLPDLAGREQHVTMTLPRVGAVRVSEFHLGRWHLQIASPLEPQRRLIATYARVAGLLVAGTACASLGLGWAFSRLALRPLRAIEQTAQRIRGDNLGERIPVPPGNDELARLAALLNQTFDRIEQSFAQVRRFTADASHELKTPLALLRLGAERLHQRLAAEAALAPHAAAVGELLEDIDRLHQIVEALLFLSKAEAGVLPVPMQPVELTDLLTEVTEDGRALAEDAGQSFDHAAPLPAGRVRGVPTLLRQLLLNLVSNAVQANPRGGRITLEARSGSGAEGKAEAATPSVAWEIVITDEGPGLPPEQLERVFERFVRFVPDGRVEPPGAPRGHGLGLAIARSIAELHGGSLCGENRRDRSGLRMIVRLPAAG